MITASHNSKEYNGYKVYGKNGAQYLPIVTNVIGKYYRQLIKTSIPFQFNKLLDKSLVIYLKDSEVKQMYFTLMTEKIYQDHISRHLKIVYSNLSGAGKDWTPVLLKSFGYDVTVVPEQYEYDPDFKTCPSPNPEKSSVFELGLKIANKNNADLIIINDGDADRMGIAAKTSQNQYRLFNGNETAALLFFYLLENQKDKIAKMSHPTIYSTHVSSHLTDLMALNYNVAIHKTLTGFKWICNAIDDKIHQNIDPVMGYEEAYGYCFLSEVLDKDGIQAGLFIAEATNYFSKQGKCLDYVLKQLYQKFGYFCYETDVLKISQYTRKYRFNAKKNASFSKR